MTSEDVDKIPEFKRYRFEQIGVKNGLKVIRPHLVPMECQWLSEDDPFMGFDTMGDLWYFCKIGGVLHKYRA